MTRVAAVETILSVVLAVSLGGCADLRDATVVTLYMGSEMNAKLIPQLQTLRPGTRIVSHDFGIGDIPADEAVETNSKTDHRKHTIYLWTCPLARQGSRPGATPAM